MLPPVQTQSRATPIQQDGQAGGADARSAAMFPVNGLIRVDQENASAIAGRINDLMLNGRGSIQSDLATIADLAGPAIGLVRQPGESDSAFTTRFITALADLKPGDRLALQTSLANAMKGLQLDMLLQILSNPEGPEAALLSAAMDILRNNRGDLKTQSVVLSYSQNDAAPVKTSQLGGQGTPLSPTGEMSPAASPAGATVDAETSAAVILSRPSAPTSVPQESIGPSPATLASSASPSMGLEPGSGAPEGSGTTPALTAPSASNRLQDASALNPASSLTANIGPTTLANAAPEPAMPSIDGQKPWPLSVANPNAQAAAPAAPLQQQGETAVPLAAATATQQATIAGVHQSLAAASQNSAQPVNRPTVAATSGPSQQLPIGWTEEPQSTVSGDRNALHTSRMDANPGAVTPQPKDGQIPATDKGAEPLSHRPSAAIEENDQQNRALEAQSALLLMTAAATINQLVDVLKPAEHNTAAETALFRQVFFQTPETITQPDSLADQTDTAHDAANPARSPSSSTGSVLPQDAYAEEGSTAQTSAVRNQQLVLSVAASQQPNTSVIVQTALPLGVPLPVVSYLAVQDEIDKDRPHTIDAIDALGDDEDDERGQKQQDRQQQQPDDAPQGEPDDTRNEEGVYAIVDLFGQDGQSIVTMEAADTPPLAAETLSLPSPAHEEAFPAENLYRRMADLA
ncbi:hypothetical protein NAC44_05225 [Allorhizobium sp. BGMRC 0089]|uniref:hypothetical protein n=1 Tax=Allorhizobium sonneratiae TaxID=2934936 RepID=UPI0020337929|nr:hypothetical protein [Allorhizobium sonneratiae]MCM2291728.1 hypothetical protein [Allorhizobium sonneratiae]